MHSDSYKPQDFELGVGRTSRSPKMTKTKSILGSLGLPDGDPEKQAGEKVQGMIDSNPHLPGTPDLSLNQKKKEI